MIDGKTMYFTRMDPRKATTKYVSRKENEPNITHMTRDASYEGLVMPFDLTNTPSFFCTLMNRIFHPHLDEFVVMYLDDISSIAAHWKSTWTI